MSLPFLWIIGDWQEPVFADSIAWLHAHSDCHCSDVSSAIAQTPNVSENSRPLRTMVLFQSHPGQFSQQELETLHAREPLACLIVMTGPWCEGEQRSGNPIAGIVRVPWRNWRERLPLELSLERRSPPLPRTAAETERIQRAAALVSHFPPLSGSAVICATKSAGYEYVADAVQKLGLMPARFDPTASFSTPPIGIIFDGWQEVSLYRKIQVTNGNQRRPRHLLVLHFPRPDDHVLAAQMDIDAVLAEPLSLAELRAAFLSVMTPAA